MEPTFNPVYASVSEAVSSHRTCVQNAHGDADAGHEPSEEESLLAERDGTHPERCDQHRTPWGGDQTEDTVTGDASHISCSAT